MARRRNRGSNNIIDLTNWQGFEVKYDADERSYKQTIGAAEIKGKNEILVAGVGTCILYVGYDISGNFKPVQTYQLKCGRPFKISAIMKYMFASATTEDFILEFTSPAWQNAEPSGVNEYLQVFYK